MAIDLFPYTAKGIPIYFLVDGKEVTEIDAGTGITVCTGNSQSGSIASSDFDVVLKADDTIIYKTTCTTGYYYTSEMGISLNPGTYTFTIIVDYDDDVAESNEENNIYTVTLRVNGCTDYFVKTSWNQKDYIAGSDKLQENAYVPVDPSTGERCVTGCTNTAWAQIVNYYFTEKGNDFTFILNADDAYTKKSIVIDATEENAATYGYLSFAEINKNLEVYDPNSAEDIASLMFACGVISQSEYGSSGTSTSSASDGKILTRIGFESYKTAYNNYNADLIFNGAFTDAGWNEMKENMNAGNPVFLSLSGIGHAVFADGYNSADDTLHVNFGWGITGGKNSSRYTVPISTGSGWYTRAELAKLYVSSIIYDITIDETAPELKSVEEEERTEDSVTVSADFSDNVGIWKTYYRVKSAGEWTEYTAPVKVTSSCVLEFMAKDKAKNESDIAEYKVIITTPPSKVYINSEYTEESCGGHKWGYDAFDNYADAAKAAPDAAIEQTGGTYDKITAANGNEITVNDGTFAVGAILTGGKLCDTKGAAQKEEILGDTSITVKDGTFNSNVLGADVVATGSAERTGDAVLEINDGQFNKIVAGGMYFRVNGRDKTTYTQDMVILCGDVDMVIKGGTFNSRVYGGNVSAGMNDPIYAKASLQTTIEKNVNLTIDSSDRSITFNDHVIAGSTDQGRIAGNTVITFTGSNAVNFAEGKYVYGGCSADYYKISGGTRTAMSGVEGTKTLAFDNFKKDSSTANEFSALIGMFDSIKFSNDSLVDFTNGNLTLSDIKNWELDWGSFADLNSASNDFSKDTLDIDMTDAGPGKKILMTGTDAAMESIFSEDVNVNIGGIKADLSGGAWIAGSYTLSLEDSTEAGFKNMVVTVA